MPITIQDNSVEWFREFDKRCEEALTDIGHAVLEQGPIFTPFKTGATLNSEDKNVIPEEKRVEIGASTEYALAIMTGSANRESKPFLIQMLLAASAGIRKAFNKE